MDGLYVEVHYVEVYMQCWSCFKVWLKQNFFDMKDFDCNYSLIYPTFFRWLLQFLPLFIFLFASKTSLLSLQSHPRDALWGSFQAKLTIRPFRPKFAQKMDLGLKFHKNFVKIKFSILEV